MHASIDAFLNAMTARGASPNTIRAYRADIKMFFVWTGDGNLDRAGDFLVAHFDEWSPATVLRRKASLRAYGRYCGRRDLLEDFRAPTPAPAVSHPLPEGMDGVAAMIDGTRTKRYKALIALMGYCGLRSAEALAVRHEDLSVDAAGRRWLQVRGKGKKQRRIVVHDAVWEHLAPFMKARTTGTVFTMNDRVLRRRVSEIGFRALGHHVAPHDLRHTAGTAFYYNAGKDIRATQNFLGHSNSATTEIYIGVTETTLADGANFWKGETA